ncbi:MAG TPA: hypothetical protein VEK77_07495 [Gemmatimonadales bacterium]|nr:hypothetical protein [Gemmatimonadales bacterium]
MFAAPRNNALRQCGTDPWQASDFAHICTIEVDALPWHQWAGKARRAIGDFSQRARPGFGGRLESNITWRVIWRG